MRNRELSVFNLRVTFDQINGFAEFVWTAPGSVEAIAIGRVHCTGADELTGEVDNCFTWLLKEKLLAKWPKCVSGSKTACAANWNASMTIPRTMSLS
jgi:hypothetical protein